MLITWALENGKHWKNISKLDPATVGYMKYFHIWKVGVYFYYSTETQMCLKASEDRYACLHIVSASQSNYVSSH